MTLFGFHWLCEIQSEVQRGPLWHCSDIWASQQKWHQYFLLSYFQLVYQLPSAIPLCPSLKEQSLARRRMLHLPFCSFVSFTSSYTSFTSSLIKLSHTGSVLTCRKRGWNQNPSSIPSWFGSDKDTKTLHVANIKFEWLYLSCGGNHITPQILKMC